MKQQDWRAWLAGRRENSQMRVGVIPISEAWPWRAWFDALSRLISVGRDDRKFHEAVTARVDSAKREVSSYTTLLFREATQPGDEGLMILVGDGAGNFLIQAKAEPGNDTEGKILLAATLQVSRANLGQVHGGVRPPRAELYEKIASSKQCLIRADGARFLDKRNIFVLVHVDRCTFEISENERWFTDAELREALQEGDVGELLAHAWLAAIKM